MTEIQRVRFWAKVLQTEACWIWRGAVDKDGYGYYAFAEGEKKNKAHHLAFEDQIGPIPLGLFVLHHCDNPPCVNPQHLFLGTQQDNLADMCAKGRQARGESHGLSQLNSDDIIAIRRFKQERVPQHAIAKWFGISQGNVSNIIHRKRWGHVP